MSGIWHPCLLQRGPVNWPDYIHGWEIREHRPAGVLVASREVIQPGNSQMKALLAALSILVLPGLMPALAHTPPAQAEASMLLAGSITVSPQGAVQSYTVDKLATLPAPVQQLLTQNVPHWRFEPVIDHGHAVAAKAAMHLRIVATPTDKDHFALRIASQWFGNAANTYGLTIKNQTLPHYPGREIKERVSGTVYLVARINRQGKVDQVAAEQVNLRVRGPEMLMRMWRKDLADASVRAASHWTYNVPASGAAATQQAWIVRIPVSYTLHEMGKAKARSYGTWTAYLPGPREKISWLKPEASVPDSADALPDNGLYLADQSLHLITTPKS